MEDISTSTNDKSQTISTAIKQYGEKLLYFIRGRVNSREDAEDIAQDIWMRFVSILNVTPIEDIGAWLYKVARNRITDEYRKNKPETINEINDDSETGLLLLTIPENTLDNQLFWQALKNALDELPIEQKQVFILHELEDLSFKQIGEITGEKIATLISRKHYAIKYLRENLQTHYKTILFT